MSPVGFEPASVWLWTTALTTELRTCADCQVSRCVMATWFNSTASQDCVKWYIMKAHIQHPNTKWWESSNMPECGRVASLSKSSGRPVWIRFLIQVEDCDWESTSKNSFNEGKMTLRCILFMTGVAWNSANALWRRYRQKVQESPSIFTDQLMDWIWLKQAIDSFSQAHKIWAFSLWAVLRIMPGSIKEGFLI